MKLQLRLYSKEAAIILQRAAFWDLSPKRVKLSYLKREADNGLVFIDEYSNAGTATFRRQLSRALTEYKKSNLVRHEANKAKESRKVECVRLIVLEKDEKAKKSYPCEYAALKGKPLDPLRASAVEVLTKEIVARMREADKKALVLPHGVFHNEWLKLKEEISDLKVKLNELRGFPPSKEDSWSV